MNVCELKMSIITVAKSFRCNYYPHGDIKKSHSAMTALQLMYKIDDYDYLSWSCRCVLEGRTRSEHIQWQVLI